jgi:Tol biopolymer transport system component
LAETISSHNPVILYRNHAEFQQTTAVMNDIGVGTGGVTEGLKRRIVMPFSFSDYQTAHVLGHELVHAFQYHIIQHAENMRPGSIMNVPLWMIEGMAEYLSIGNTDAFTAVWMRDALLNNDFPDFKNLTRGGKYSPYRYGQAFWSYIASKYGEQYIRRIFVYTAHHGFKQAAENILAISPDSLSHDWRTTLEKQLLTRSDSSYTILGERILTDQNSGRYNLAPAVSPNGKYLVFLSERDVYSLDLFLADAHTGEVISKIYTNSHNDGIDALEFTESCGTWSPDSRYFAYVGYRKGRSVIFIHDVKNNHVKRRISPPMVDGISSPAWSPGGSSLAFIGMNKGVSDLYLYSLDENSCENITQSNQAVLQPAWSWDGETIWFVTDEAAPGQSFFFPGNLNIACIDVATAQTTVLKTFDGARNLNPVPVPGTHKLFFLSNVEGRRDLYILNTQTAQISQGTQYAGGIMGLTEMSPALSVGKKHVFYSMLWKGQFQMVKVPYNALIDNAHLAPLQSFDYRSARLSPYSKQLSVVDQNLIYNGVLQPLKVSLEKIEPKSNFKLDYVGNMAAGVMSGRLGTGMAGSIEALFSDILGHNLLYTGASINGEIYDFGGHVTMINQKYRVKTGGGFSHIPYRMGYYSYEEADEGNEIVYYRRRIFEDKGFLFAYLPLSRSTRLEAGSSIAHYGYRFERIENVRTYYPTYQRSGTRLDAPKDFWVGNADVAYVFDNSSFGMTSPVDGNRMRIQFEQFYNGIDARALLFDLRKYILKPPYSFAFRAYYYGRYGKDQITNRMSRLFVGYPWLVRGYDTGGFYADSTKNQRSIGVKHLLGSKLLISNIEWRMPLTGPIDFAWIKSSTFLSELALFIDAGLAWDADSEPVFSLLTSSDAHRIPVFSSGMAIRLNFFGVIIIEPYFAFPFHQERFFSGQFGFNVLPGW